MYNTAVKITYEQLRNRESSDYYIANRGTVRNGKLDRSGRFYHVMTHSYMNETLFLGDVAQYRNQLLCRMCAARGVTILFSVIMPNHTHEVFMTDNWKLISDIMKSVNTNVTKYIHKNHKEMQKRKPRLFEPDILYVAIKDVGSLLYVGKYLYDNPLYLGDSPKVKPLTCFWCFARNYYPAGYDRTIYRKLFGLDAPQLTNLYATRSKEDISKLAANLASTWSREQTNAVFINHD